MKLIEAGNEKKVWFAIPRTDQNQFVVITVNSWMTFKWVVTLSKVLLLDFRIISIMKVNIEFKCSDLPSFPVPRSEKSETI